MTDDSEFCKKCHKMQVRVEEVPDRLMNCELCGHPVDNQGLCLNARCYFRENLSDPWWQCNNKGKCGAWNVKTLTSSSCKACGNLNLERQTKVNEIKKKISKVTCVESGCKRVKLSQTAPGISSHGYCRECFEAQTGNCA